MPHTNLSQQQPATAVSFSLWVVVLGTATITTIGSSLVAYAWGYSQGRSQRGPVVAGRTVRNRSTLAGDQKKQTTSSSSRSKRTRDERKQQQHEGILSEELYLQMRHRGRLSFTSTDDDVDENHYTNEEEDETINDDNSTTSKEAVVAAAGTFSPRPLPPLLRGGDLCANNWHHFEGYETKNGKQEFMFTTTTMVLSTASPAIIAADDQPMDEKLPPLLSDHNTAADVVADSRQQRHVMTEAAFGGMMNGRPLPPQPYGTTLLVPRTAHPVRYMQQQPQGRTTTTTTSGGATTSNDEDTDDVTQQLEGEDRRRHSMLEISEEENKASRLGKNMQGEIREPSRIYRHNYPPRNVAFATPTTVKAATLLQHPPRGINDAGPDHSPRQLPQCQHSSSTHRRAVRTSSAPVASRLSLSAARPASPLHSPRKARTQYNARVMPHRLILVRHGQSMGNIDEGLYGTTPDNAMPLTELGWNQAKACGVHLKNKICKHWKTEGIHFIVSPYCRTVETFHGIMSAWIDPAAKGPVTSRQENRLQDWYANLAAMGLVWHEDPRLREQDFGNFQDPNVIKQAKKDRHRFGAFYYRFPHGESASDVFDRVSTFLDSLWRSFDVNDCKNYVLVTHGISIRVILTRYFRYTIDQFHLMANPRNCEIVTLRHDGRGKLVLSGRYELLFDHEKVIARYKHHKKLRCLPVMETRKTTARIAFDS